MASGTFTLYGANKADFRINDLTGLTIKIALVKSTYTPNVTATGDALWATVSANEITTAGGYTTGGLTLGTLAVAATAGNNGFKFSSANPTITATAGNIDAWRYAVMYVSGTQWAKVNPLIGYFLGDATPADIPATSVGQPLTLNCPATGWFDET